VEVFKREEASSWPLGPEFVVSQKKKTKKFISKSKQRKDRNIVHSPVHLGVDTLITGTMRVLTSRILKSGSGVGLNLP
jgi:hypothetical protein